MKYHKSPPTSWSPLGLVAKFARTCKIKMLSAILAAGALQGVSEQAQAQPVPTTWNTVYTSHGKTIKSVDALGEPSYYVTEYSGLQDPQEIAFDRNGNLYVADSASTKLKLITPTGILTDFGVSLGTPFGTGFDNSGFSYVSNKAVDSIFKLSPNGEDVVTYANPRVGVEVPGSIGISPINDELAYADNANDLAITIASPGPSAGELPTTVIGQTSFRRFIDPFSYDKDGNLLNQTPDEIPWDFHINYNSQGTLYVTLATARFLKEKGVRRVPASGNENFVFRFDPVAVDYIAVPGTKGGGSDGIAFDSADNMALGLTRERPDGTLIGYTNKVGFGLPIIIGLGSVRDVTYGPPVVTYTVNLSKNDILGGTVLLENDPLGPIKYAAGSYPTVSEKPSDNFQFIDWTQNNVQLTTDPAFSFQIFGDRNIVANFIELYEVTSTAGANGGVTSINGRVLRGTTQILTATPSQNFIVDKWYINDEIVQDGGNVLNLVNITSNKKVLVTFKTSTTGIFTVFTANSPVEGGFNSGGGAYAVNSTVTVTNITNPGYSFSYWAEVTPAGEVLVSSSPTYTFVVKQDTYLTARLIKNANTDFVITTSSNPLVGGTTVGGGAYAAGDSVVVIATPSPLYRFVNWTEAGVQVSNVSAYRFVANADRNLVANFAAISGIITVNAVPSAGGTVSGGGTYTLGDPVTLTATPAPGFNLESWTENGVVVSNALNYSIVVNGNRTLTAKFNNGTPTAVNITTASAPPEGGTTTGGGTYTLQSDVTVTATPSGGYQFVSWTEFGKIVSTTANYTFKVVQSRTLVANFQAPSGASVEITTAASPAEGGTTTGAGSYVIGTDATVTATANAGYQFVNWTENGTEVSVTTTYTFTVTTGRTLVANFVVSGTGGGGGGGGGGGTVDPNITPWDAIGFNMSWVGAFIGTQFPWINHNFMGYVYVDVNKVNGGFFLYPYRSKVKYMFTSEKVFPMVYTWSNKVKALNRTWAKIARHDKVRAFLPRGSKKWILDGPKNQ